MIRTEPQSPADSLQRGQLLETEGRFSHAIEAYDQAITGLCAVARDPAGRRALGVCWMNRGNALQKLASPVHVAEAVWAYDQAIGLFETLPFATEPAFRNHLGAAWLNRGHALIDLADTTGATESCEHAIAHLQQLPLDADISYRLNLAGAWTNLAHIINGSSPHRARTAARAALDVLGNQERERIEFAEMSLRARRALVTALGELLVEAEAAGQPTNELAHEAAEAIDGGLALVPIRQLSEIGRLRPLAGRLFRMGIQLYRLHQPHFLGEFIIENLSDPLFTNDPEFRSIANEAVAQALKDTQRPQLLIDGTTEASRVVATARSLRAAQEWLSHSSSPVATSHE